MKVTHLRIYLAIISIAVNILQGMAQVKLHGKVVDAENSPIEFVTVRIDG